MISRPSRVVLVGLLAGGAGALGIGGPVAEGAGKSPPATAGGAGKSAPPAAEGAGPPPSVTAAERRMAVTFDDLPLSAAARTPLEEQRRITRELVGAIESRGIPAVGFVNEGKLEADGALDPRRVDLLRAWLDAGVELGNHTYSHPDLHRVPLEVFLADAARGDRVMRRLLAERGGSPRWFRHPFLHTGRSLATRDSVHAWLEGRGYRVAPVTVDNEEYIFAAAYDAAVAAGDVTAAREAGVGDRAAARDESGAGDEAAVARVAEAYLDYMMDVVAYYEEQSDALFGRAIPHVLLVHANALNGRAFGALADRLAARGYAFVPLEEAVADPAYDSPDEYAGPGGITWLHRWALTAGKRGEFFAGEPEAPGWVRELAARR